MTGRQGSDKIIPPLGRHFQVRRCFQTTGYVFAKHAAEIMKEHGITRIARLASNENPDPPSRNVVEEGTRLLTDANRYPDETMGSLIDALRKHYGDYHFVTGVGMDGIIETTIRTLVEPTDLVVVSTPTFSFYRLSAIAQGAGVEEVARNLDYSVDPESFIEACEEAKLAFLCSPNNPTGNATPVKTIKTILDRIDCVLFLDNAYVEFSDYDYSSLMNDYENLIIGRTFSKAHSLAGLRVGYAFVPSWFGSYYLRASTPHTLNSVSAGAAALALGDQDHVTRAKDRARKWREEYLNRLKWPVHPTDANFVMVDVSPYTSDEMVENLASLGVLVRSCRSFRGLPDHFIRISVGDDWENEMCINALNSL
ncbi:MAG TPA: histidinol-phosphate transaminase [Methanoregulaceae archaeon]|nr:histidinol-phosphate transaminase [Methanoregulaceae archaeon]